MLVAIRLSTLRETKPFFLPTNPVFDGNRSRPQRSQRENTGHFFDLLAERAATRSSHIAVRRVASWLCTVRCEECDRNSALSLPGTITHRLSLSELCALCERQVLFPLAHSPVGTGSFETAESSEKCIDKIFVAIHWRECIQCMACDPA